MRDIAAWMVASARNAVLALSGTMLVPILQPISCMVLVLLVLAKGPRLASAYIAMSSLIVLLLAMVLGWSTGQFLVVIVVTWAPVYLLALTLVMTRSFALTMQVSALTAILVAVALTWLISDPVTFWQPVITLWLEMTAQGADTAGIAEDIRSPEFAARISGMLVVSGWMIYSVVFMLGYIIYERWAEKSGQFGRIRDLNFGRVLASAMVLVLALSYLAQSTANQNAAVMFFAVFWMQGVALIYWLYAVKRLPLIAVVAAFVLPLLSAYVAVAMTVFGYLDAWFDVRRRLNKT